MFIHLYHHLFHVVKCDSVGALQNKAQLIPHLDNSLYASPRAAVWTAKNTRFYVVSGSESWPESVGTPSDHVCKISASSAFPIGWKASK